MVSLGRIVLLASSLFAREYVGGIPCLRRDCIIRIEYLFCHTLVTRSLHKLGIYFLGRKQAEFLPEEQRYVARAP